jgi:hypothetical protein
MATTTVRAPTDVVDEFVAFVPHDLHSGSERSNCGPPSLGMLSGGLSRRFGIQVFPRPGSTKVGNFHSLPPGADSNSDLGPDLNSTSLGLARDQAVRHV